jgi:hypothetical protein
MLNNTLMPISVALIIITIFISRSWLYEWRSAAIEAEQLKSEKFASQYQSLKDQLNPHFLFNSLNVLSNLVYESADKSAEFIQQLSKIYRYVLDVQNRELVGLEKEVVFAENYLSLQKIRFEQSLEYFIDVNQMKGWNIPPLSLQLSLGLQPDGLGGNDPAPTVGGVEPRRAHAEVRAPVEPEATRLGLPLPQRLLPRLKARKWRQLSRRQKVLPQILPQERQMPAATSSC